VETSTGYEGYRAYWQTLVGRGDSTAREALNLSVSKKYSWATLADLINLCGKIGATLLINYNDFGDTAYFHTGGADTTSIPHYPDTGAIFADFDSLLDYIYGSESGNTKYDTIRYKDDSVRIASSGDDTIYAIPVIWLIGDDMPNSYPWTKGWGLIPPSTILNGYSWGDTVDDHKGL